MSAFAADKGEGSRGPARLATLPDSGAKPAPSPGATEFWQLLKQRCPQVIALGVAIGASEQLNIFPVVVEAEGIDLYRYISTSLFNRPFDMMVIMVVFTAVQAWFPPSKARVSLMAIALIVVALAWSALRGSPWAMALTSTPLISIGLGVPGLSMWLYNFWIYLVFGGLHAIFCEWQLRADLLSRELQDIRIADETTERHTLEARLSGMKARVDPAFLFAVIERIEECYQRDAAAAEHLLEKLIDYLRASLPHGRDSRPTAAEEMALCASFLAIMQALNRHAFTHETLCDEAAAHCKVAPLLLLPLLRLLVPADELSSGVRHCSITAVRNGSSLIVEMKRSGEAPPPDADSVAAATIALRASYGGQASVVADPFIDNVASIRLEVPCASC